MEIFLFVLLTIYLVVLVRVAILQVSLLREAFRQDDCSALKKFLLMRGFFAIFLWPIDFCMVPRIFFKAYVLADLFSAVQLGLYYSRS